MLQDGGITNYGQKMLNQASLADQPQINQKRSTSNPRGKSGGRRIIANGANDSNQNSNNPSNSNSAAEGGNLKKFSQHLYKHTE